MKKSALYEHLRNLSKKSPKMIFALIIIGCLAIILTIFVWFTPWSENDVPVTLTSPVPLNSPLFFRTLEGITQTSSFPIQKNEEVKVLNNGDEFVPDFLQEIKNAKSSITVANYIWEEGILTNSILDTLTQKANEGVEVRILMDAKGSLNAPIDKLKALEEAGGKIGTFRPLGLRTITRLNKRTHLRAIVIDGKIGYTGGLAFNDEWLGNGTQPNEWRDMMFKFSGHGARSIQNMFSNLWRQTTGEILVGEKFYPTLPPITVSDPCAETCLVPLFHAPTPDLEKNLSDMLWLSISGAKDYIILETPYLLPNKDLMTALKKKAQEGVRIDILVPGPYVDSRIVQIASRSYYNEILDAGIHLYEYEPAHMHSKVFVADGEWSIVGSANLDNRSSTLNVEGVIGVKDTRLAKEIERQFEIDKERSKEVSKENFSLGITDKLFGRISRLFAKQY